MNSFLLLVLTTPLAAGLLAQESGTAEPAVAFRSVDLYLDSAGQPLAAYQVEFSAADGGVRFVGVEGGEHAAFRSPPFFDPRRLRQERLVLAAYSTAEDLPKGKTRIATVHFQTATNRQPEFTLKIQAAAALDGKKIPLTATLVERKSE